MSVLIRSIFLENIANAINYFAIYSISNWDVNSKYNILNNKIKYQVFGLLRDCFTKIYSTEFKSSLEMNFSKWLIMIAYINESKYYKNKYPKTLYFKLQVDL